MQLSEENYEKVNYWQSILKPTEIDITPNQLDSATGKAVKGDRVKDIEIIACLFDQDAVFTSLDYKRSFSTPYNPKGEYRNLFFNWDFLSAEDDTENFIVYYLADEDEPTPTASITLNKTETSIAAGATETLTATTVPANAVVTWTSSDETAATVEGGVVTALAEKIKLVISAHIAQGNVCLVFFILQEP